VSFRNSIFGFQGNLTRDQIKSPNYVPNVSGWIVRRDGSAEFNDVVIRDGVVVSGTSLYYDPSPGAGNLVMSISAQAGIDEYGNVYPAGLTAFSANGTINIFETTSEWDNVGGSRVRIQVGTSAGIDFRPEDVLGTTWNVGSVGAGLTTDFGPNTPALNLNSPYSTVNTRSSTIIMLGGSPTMNRSKIRLVAQETQVIGGPLTAPNMLWGTAQTPAPGGAPAQTFVDVVFSAAMTAIPSVVLTPNSTAANLNTTNIRWAITNKTINGFRINCWRDTNNATNFEWQASSD
jgi:hypothetical protein